MCTSTTYTTYATILLHYMYSRNRITKDNIRVLTTI